MGDFAIFRRRVSPRIVWFPLPSSHLPRFLLPHPLQTRRILVYTRTLPPAHPPRPWRPSYPPSTMPDFGEDENPELLSLRRAKQSLLDQIDSHNNDSILVKRELVDVKFELTDALNKVRPASSSSPVHCG